MSVPKLSYFDFGGRALAARLAFRIGGIAFEDVRIKPSEWPALQKDRTRFPLAQLPTLELPKTEGGAWTDGQLLSQSYAITFYAGRLAKLQPSDAAEASVHDNVVLTAEELFTGWDGWRTVRFAAPEERDQKLATFLENNLKPTFGLLEATLTQSGEGGYFLRSGLSTADLIIFAYLHYFFNTVPSGIPSLPLPQAVLEGFPRLAGHFARVSAIPVVADYLAAFPGG